VLLPDLESLRCFEAAAMQLNFRAAARSVGLSPAAFGDRIKRLEGLLEARLFERTTRRVSLTPEGERLLPRARQCLQQAELCHQAVRGSERAPFELTIGTRFELGLSWITPALKQLERAEPARTVHLAFGDTPELLRLLRRDAVDGIVTSARIASSGLSYARLHEEGYVLVATPQLLKEHPLQRLAHAARHTLLELNRELPLFRYFLDARPGDEVWSFGRTLFLGTIGAVRARALEGARVAVLLRCFVADDLKRQRLKRSMPSVKMPLDWFRLIWRSDHPRQQALHQLAGELSALPLR
jgi:DNA-binding transcriptional LysR family regulator